MTWVKLTIRAEPQEVSDEELAALRGQNLVEEVLDDPPADGGSPPPETDAGATAAGTEESR